MEADRRQESHNETDLSSSSLPPAPDTDEDINLVSRPSSGQPGLPFRDPDEQPVGGEVGERPGQDPKPNPGDGCSRRGGLFSLLDICGPKLTTPPGRSGARPRERSSSVRVSGHERSLFDFVRTEPAGPAAPEAAKPDAEASASESSEPLVFSIAAGEKAKARDILTAIRTVKTIDQEQRAPTREEGETLVRFGGFGPVALSIFPDPVTGRYKDAGWETLGEELKSLLSPQEYESAKRTTFNAFYTSPTVIAAMHEALARLGVPGSATILEPGCGTGNFMSQGRDGLHFIGVELDRISGRIAKLLHPGQDIRIENFRDTSLAEGSIDAVIGNVPFADVKLDYRGMRLSLHDFFFAKSIDALKPGGVLALITSHFTLDKQNAALREYLALRADFVGAIRLPSDAFKREGTSVVTDIVFLRKRASGEPESHADRGWTQALRMPKPRASGYGGSFRILSSTRTSAGTAPRASGPAPLSAPLAQ